MSAFGPDFFKLETEGAVDVETARLVANGLLVAFCCMLFVTGMIPCESDFLCCFIRSTLSAIDGLTGVRGRDETGDELEPVERRLGVRVLERGEGEPEEVPLGVTARGEEAPGFLTGTLSFEKRVNVDCVRPEFRSADSLLEMFEPGEDGFVRAAGCCCFFRIPLGADWGCLVASFFCFSVGESFREVAVMGCLTLAEAAGDESALLEYGVLISVIDFSGLRNGATGTPVEEVLQV